MLATVDCAAVLFGPLPRVFGRGKRADLAQFGISVAKGPQVAPAVEEVFHYSSPLSSMSQAAFISSANLAASGAAR